MKNKTTKSNITHTHHFQTEYNNINNVVKARYQTMDIYDVIIIGCGSAGIGAGIEFEKVTSKSINYLILEARNRIGGRAYTDITTFGKDIPLDHGAHYICHHEENNFLRQFYVPSEKDFVESDSYDNSTMVIYDQQGIIIEDELINKATKYADDLLSATEGYSNETSDISLFDLVNTELEAISDLRLKSLVKMTLSYIECHEGSNITQLSSKLYGKGEGDLPESDLTITDGLGTLVQHIASKYNLPIKLNSIVTDIDASNDI
ncbi:unnamed protein product, partial [Adineta ricciae]